MIIEGAVFAVSEEVKQIAKQNETPSVTSVLRVQ